MAAPNQIALASMLHKTALLEATNTMTDIIAAAGTGHNFNVEAIVCNNIHATVRGWVTVVLKRGGTEHLICNQVSIGAKSAPINVLPDGRPLFMEESDSLRIQANASSNICVFASYQDCS